MYDAANEEWAFRQTGIMVAVPEIWGHIFVGRTKEGFSLNKVMIGYGGLDAWSVPPISDAMLPDSGRRHQVARLRAEGPPHLEPRVLRRRAVGRTGVLHVREPDLRPSRLGAGVVSRRRHPAPPRRQRPVRQGRRTASCGFAPAREHCRRRTSSTPENLPPTAARMTGLEIYYRPGSLTFGVGILHAEGRRAGVRRSVLPWRRSLHVVAGHRRDAHLQHARRLLQSDLAAAADLLRRARAPGSSWRTSPTPISTAARSPAASSGGSRRWSTGTSRTTSGSSSPTATARSTASA